MTTTDDRPLTLPAAEIALSPQRPPAHRQGKPGRPSRMSYLARRLPYSLAVLALAAGYAIGHDTSNPAPKLSASGPAIVTPQQINQALSATNGVPELNDRGFSQLENGVQHSHGFESPVTASDRRLLSQQLTLAQQVALKFPTLADAEKAGMRPEGPFSPGLGLHVSPSVPDVGDFAGSGPMTDAQIEHPQAWIYDGTKPTSRIAGLMYTALATNPQGFAGPNDIWHTHSNICLVRRAGGGFDTPLGADRSVTTAQCQAVHGFLLKKSPPLLHVWVVPGYESSQGVFSHLSPALTCNDGTYHVINTATIGVRTTTCIDGTE